VSLSDGKTSDIAEARRLSLPRGSMVVCDKGYTDFAQDRGPGIRR